MGRRLAPKSGEEHAAAEGKSVEIEEPLPSRVKEGSVPWTGGSRAWSLGYGLSFGLELELGA